MDEAKARSIDPKDYQELPQPIGAMAKIFADGFVIPLHLHERDQLLYAIRGVMRVRTARHAWVVPPDGAVYIPAGTPHSVSMHGDVDMRTLYIDADALRDSPPSLCVIGVSSLLRELVLALSEEPIDYDMAGRGGLIAQLVGLEIGCAGGLPLSVSLPYDPRLQRVCAGLLADPSDRRTLEGWSEMAGASPRTLARLFVQDLGTTFNNWRQRARFHDALEMLCRGETISRVAISHGYRSTSAFSAAFKKVMGFPPSRASISLLDPVGQTREIERD